MAYNSRASDSSSGAHSVFLYAFSVVFAANTFGINLNLMRVLSTSLQTALLLIGGMLLLSLAEAAYAQPSPSFSDDIFANLLDIGLALFFGGVGGAVQYFSEVNRGVRQPDVKVFSRAVAISAVSGMMGYLVTPHDINWAWLLGIIVMSGWSGERLMFIYFQFVATRGLPQSLSKRMDMSEAEISEEKQKQAGSNGKVS